MNAKIIYILDSTYHPQIKKRFKILTNIFSKAGVDIVTIESKENDFKVRIMDLIFLSDWISYYVGLLRGYDPSEIDNIYTLKNGLK
jgi:glucose/mannose-6-phosphate isomerase